MAKGAAKATRARRFARFSHEGLFSEDYILGKTRGQVRTTHLGRDRDWLQFYAVAVLTVIIMVSSETA